MKKITLLLISLIGITYSAYSQKRDFKYEGDLPKDKFVIISSDESTFVEEDSDAIALRNRVYIIMDSLGNVLLNSHEPSLSNFQEQLAYVITNPDRHSHLPESVNTAVIFTNVFDWISATPEDEVLAFKGRCVALAMNNVYHDLKIKYLVEVRKKDWMTIRIEDLQAAQEKFKLTIATPVYVDKGIRVKLPDWAQEIDEEQMKKRNILSVMVNAKNEVLVREQIVEIKAIRKLAKQFISNPDQQEDLAESPKQAIISLKNDRGTSYALYLKVYNELRGAYQELWEEAAQAEFGKNFDALSSEGKKKIRMLIPFVLSETEPTDLGEE